MGLPAHKLIGERSWVAENNFAGGSKDEKHRNNMFIKSYYLLDLFRASLENRGRLLISLANPPPPRLLVPSRIGGWLRSTW